MSSLVFFVYPVAAASQNSRTLLSYPRPKALNHDILKSLFGHDYARLTKISKSSNRK